jgi:hypothetical protein
VVEVHTAETQEIQQVVRRHDNFAIVGSQKLVSILGAATEACYAADWPDVCSVVPGDGSAASELEFRQREGIGDGVRIDGVGFAVDTTVERVDVGQPSVEDPVMEFVPRGQGLAFAGVLHGERRCGRRSGGWSGSLRPAAAAGKSEAGQGGYHHDGCRDGAFADQIDSLRSLDAHGNVEQGVFRWAGVARAQFGRRDRELVALGRHVRIGGGDGLSHEGRDRLNLDARLVLPGDGLAGD